MRSSALDRGWHPVAIILILAGCTGPSDPDGPAGDDDDDTTPEAIVRSVTSEPTGPSEASLSVELSEAASVAAACVRRDEPAEIHLLEGEGDSAVELRFVGLLSATDYDCSVAAIAPAGAEPVKTSFRTQDPPPDRPSADAISNPSHTMTGTYTVMNVKPECSRERGFNIIVVLDPEGNNRWTYEPPRGLNIGIEVIHDGPNRFLWGGGRDKLGGPAVIDVRDGEVWKYQPEGGEELIYHHDVNRLEDGRILSVEESDAPGWDAFQLRLIEQETHETSWFWDVQSAVADGWLPEGSEETPDPHHLNWADVVETDQGLVAYGSLCYSEQIVAIDVATSAPLWRFGGITNEFTMVDENGDQVPGDFPQCQHGVQTDGTHLLMYDNGFRRGYTRAVEYSLDLENKTATKTWEWLDEGFWEEYHGGTDWLTPDHSRVLVAEGNNDCGEISDRHSQIVEIDRTSGAEVHRLILRDISHWLYRAHRVDGCGVFENTRYCPALAERLEELRESLDL